MIVSTFRKFPPYFFFHDGFLCALCANRSSTAVNKVPVASCRVTESSHIDVAILDRDAWQLGHRRAILKQTILKDVSNLLGPIVSKYFFVLTYFLLLMNF